MSRKRSPPAAAIEHKIATLGDFDPHPPGIDLHAATTSIFPFRRAPFSRFDSTTNMIAVTGATALSDPGMIATDDTVHDSEAFVPIVQQVLDRGIRVTRVLTDGAYDARKNFDFLDVEIEPVVRMRSNANMKRMGGAARPLAIRGRNLLGEVYWRFVHGYGRRWAIEGTFSAIKRVLGENFRSRRDNLRLREAQRKAVAYDRLLMA